MNRMVSDVMVTPVVSVQPATSFKQTVGLLQEHRVSALPVVDRDGRLLGIVSETDLALKEEHHPGEPVPFFEGGRHREQRAKARGTTAADFMSSPVATVALGASLNAAARLLHRRAVRHLPVVDHDGRLIGIITRRDLLKVFLRPNRDIHHEITADVLRATFNLPADAVRVEVRDGVVTLTGLVPWRSSARALVGRLGGMDGVVDVVDRLSWTHDDTVRVATTPWG
jgi:CBS-domain-containing membrane protein